MLTLVTLCSGALERSVQEQMVILGSMSIGGTITKVPELVNTLQVCFDAGAKKILLPMTSAADIVTVPHELYTKLHFTRTQLMRCSRRWEWGRLTYGVILWLLKSILGTVIQTSAC